MKSNKKFGYTLAEVMIVLLVLTIIFAAFAPIITKRTTTKSPLVWDWVSYSTDQAFYKQFNAYTDSERIFVGVKPYLNQINEIAMCNPYSSNEEYKLISEKCKFYPDSRLTIRSMGQVANDDIQRQIQFRFGGSKKCSNGDVNSNICTSTNDYTRNNFAGSWLMDGKNILLGGKYQNLKYTEKQSNKPDHNIAIGFMALNNIENSITPAKNNIAIGSHAGFSIKNKAQDNVMIGYRAGFMNTFGSGNVMVGADAGYSNTEGNYNVFLGYKAGYYNTTGSNNVYAGSFAGRYLNGDNNIAIGPNSIGGWEEATDTARVNGNYNVAIGRTSLSRLGKGGDGTESYDKNTAIGSGACAYLYRGSNKTCIGASSGYSLSYSPRSFPADNNLHITYIGRIPQYIGTNSLETNTNEWNTLSAAGETELSLDEYLASTKRNYTFYGCKDYINNREATAPGGTNQCYYRNSRRGRYSYQLANAVIEIYGADSTNDQLKYVYGHYGTIGLDDKTLNTNATTMITGNLVVRGRMFSTVGSNLYAWTKTDVNNSSIIENTDNTNIMGASNRIGLYDYNFIENTNNALPKLSDRRLKNITSKNNSGLDKISKLKVYNFNFINDNNKEQHVGVIAQELEKIFPNSVFEDEDGILQIKWDEMFYASINAIKELDKKIIALVKRAIKVEEKIVKLEKQNTELKSQVAQLSARVDRLKNK